MSQMLVSPGGLQLRSSNYKSWLGSLGGRLRRTLAGSEAALRRARSLCVCCTVVALLAIQAGLLAYSATCNSPTFDEAGHLVAGVSHWHFGRFELYRVNPPLARMVAAVPVLAAGCKTDWSGFYESPGARPVFSIGEDFIAANGERSRWLFTISRWACIPFSFIGGLVCFLWGRELYGTAAGLLVLTLWCFEPNVLAHGGLITPDCAATSFGLLAGYLFWRWLKKLTWSHALAAGVGLGIAELAKMTWIILFGLWPLLWIVWWLTGRQQERSWQASSRQLGQLLFVLVVGLFVLNLGYGFDGTFARLEDFTFVSETFTGAEHAAEGGNRFASHRFASLPLPVPKQYLLGIDVQKRDFEDSGRPSYLGGKWKDGGWWYYYLYGLWVKVPHGTQLLLGTAFALALLGLRQLPIPTWRDEVVLLVPAVVLLVLVSSQTGFNHHVRYVLPCLGLLLVFSGKATLLLTSRIPLLKLGLFFAPLCTIASSLIDFPHSLSYFNEFAGGSENGHKHLLHSNLDWGQDLYRADRWVAENTESGHAWYVSDLHYNPAWLGLALDWVDGSNVKEGWYLLSAHFALGDPSFARAERLQYSRPVLEAISAELSRSDSAVWITPSICALKYELESTPCVGRSDPVSSDGRVTLRPLTILHYEGPPARF